VTPKDYGDEIVKLRGELASLKSDLRNRELEIRDLRSIVASKTSQSDVAHIFGKSLKPHIATVGDFVSDVVLDAQKSLRGELGDATRATRHLLRQTTTARNTTLLSPTSKPSKRPTPSRRKT